MCLAGLYSKEFDSLVHGKQKTYVEVVLGFLWEREI